MGLSPNAPKLGLNVFSYSENDRKKIEKKFGAWSFRPSYRPPDHTGTLKF